MANALTKTLLSPSEEGEYSVWALNNQVPINSEDYDMRGFWKAQKEGDLRAQSAINPNDLQRHFPDVWKTPQHETFSSESMYAPKGAPSWAGGNLPNNGESWSLGNVAQESPWFVTGINYKNNQRLNVNRLIDLLYGNNE